MRAAGRAFHYSTLRAPTEIASQQTEMLSSRRIFCAQSQGCDSLCLMVGLKTIAHLFMNSPNPKTKQIWKASMPKIDAFIKELLETHQRCPYS